MPMHQRSLPELNGRKLAVLLNLRAALDEEYPDIKAQAAALAESPEPRRAARMTSPRATSESAPDLRAHLEMTQAAAGAQDARDARSRRAPMDDRPNGKPQPSVIHSADGKADRDGSIRCPSLEAGSIIALFICACMLYQEARNVNLF